MDYDLAYFDRETRVLEPLENPFGPKCYLCSRYVLSMSPGWTVRNWSRRWELNPRPVDYESTALPLSYFGLIYLR